MANFSPVNITVSKNPKIANLVERLNQPEGSTASITCSVGSGELDGITHEWYKGDRRLVSGGNVKIISASPDISILRIHDVKSADSATYSCVARNAHGQDKISVKLFVKGKSRTSPLASAVAKN